jgi:hypothetical protein
MKSLRNSFSFFRSSGKNLTNDSPSSASPRASGSPESPTKEASGKNSGPDSLLSTEEGNPRDPSTEFNSSYETDLSPKSTATLTSPTLSGPTVDINAVVKEADTTSPQFSPESASTGSFPRGMKRSTKERTVGAQELQHQTMRSIAKKSATKSFELLVKQKQDKFDAVFARPGVEVLALIPKGENDVRQRKCTLKCNFEAKAVVVDLSGSSVTLGFDSIEAIIKSEHVGTNAGKSGIGNQFRLCLQGKPHMDFMLENDMVCEAIIVGMIGTVVNRCPQGPLAVSIKDYESSSVPVYSTPTSFEDQIASDGGCAVTVCVPVKGGKELKRRKGVLRCKSDSITCFVDVSGAKENAPSATISFDIPDLKEIVKGTNVAASWDLSPGRAIRLVIVDRPELILEFDSEEGRNNFYSDLSAAFERRTSGSSIPRTAFSPAESLSEDAATERRISFSAKSDLNSLASSLETGMGRFSEEVSTAQSALLAEVMAKEREIIASQVFDVDTQEITTKSVETDSSDVDSLVASLDNRLSSFDGYEVTVCVPVKAGKEIKRRAATLYCKTGEKVCSMNISANKAASPSTMISFELSDLQSILKGVALMHADIDETRTLRLVITSKPELMLEFSSCRSRDIFRDAFAAVVANRLRLIGEGAVASGLEQGSDFDGANAVSAEVAERAARDESERLAKEARAEEEQLQVKAEREDRIEAERLVREESERVIREEAERSARDEAERLLKEDTDRAALEAAERLAMAEAERIAREKEEERRAREMVQMLAREEAERLEREEAERVVREEAERLARDEAERLTMTEAQRVAREKDEHLQARAVAETLAREEEERSAQEEAERVIRVETERIVEVEAERLAVEEAERQVRTREAAEALAREEIECLTAEEARRTAHEAAELLAKEEAERLAREDEEKQLAIEHADGFEDCERVTQEEAHRLEVTHAVEEADSLTATHELEQKSRLVDESSHLAVKIAHLKQLLKRRREEIADQTVRKEEQEALLAELQSVAVTAEKLRAEITTVRSKTIKASAAALLPSKLVESQRSMAKQVSALENEMIATRKQVVLLLSAREVISTENSVNESMASQLEQACVERRRELSGIESGSVFQSVASGNNNGAVHPQPSPDFMYWITFGLVGGKQE